MKTALTMLGLVVLHALSGAASAQDRPLDIRAFVQPVYVEGVPYADVMRYDAGLATGVLLQMLADPNQQPHWRNIVVTLGMLGHDSAVQPLIRFLEADSAGQRLSRQAYGARSVVPLALGYLVNRSRNAEALAYLQASARPAFWAGRNLRWASPLHDGIEARDQHLSKMAIIGLALSAQPGAAQTLRTLRGPALTDADRAFQTRVASVVDEALAAHDTIARQGLLTYDSARRQR